MGAVSLLKNRIAGALLAATTIGVTTLLGAAPAFAAGQSFTFLQAGFTQELYGTGSPANLFGGVAFAPDGDPLTDNCSFGGSPLYRFDSATTLPVTNGTSTLHPLTIEPSNAGCGLTNHPDGALYTNTGSGVVELDASTGAVLAGPFGPGGNALGITVDPQTGNLVYVLASGAIGFVDPGFTSSGVFSSPTSGNIDQITFDPTGNFLFASNDGGDALVILDRSGAIVQNIPLTVGVGPDGIAFHAAAPQFVVTNNNDGTMTRFDFPNNDFTMTPTQTLFASGGFRGDMTQVGPDGCLYATQKGTRYDDGTTSSANSLVRICPGFAPPPGVGGGTPTDKDQCKNDGWKSFTNPAFKNQGDCVSFVVSSGSMPKRLLWSGVCLRTSALTAL